MLNYCQSPLPFCIDHQIHTNFRFPQTLYTLTGIHTVPPLLSSSPANIPQNHLGTANCCWTSESQANVAPALRVCFPCRSPRWHWLMRKLRVTSWTGDLGTRGRTDWWTSSWLCTPTCRLVRDLPNSVSADSVNSFKKIINQEMKLSPANPPAPSCWSLFNKIKWGFIDRGAPRTLKLPLACSAP